MFLKLEAQLHLVVACYKLLIGEKGNFSHKGSTIFITY